MSKKYCKNCKFNNVYPCLVGCSYIECDKYTGKVIKEGELSDNKNGDCENYKKGNIIDVFLAIIGFWN